MGIWDFYFIAKLAMYFGQYMDFHAWQNILFALFLWLPLPERHAKLKPARQIIALPAGIALFYYDTWLPPFTRVIEQVSQLQDFSLTYLQELLGRFIDPRLIVVLLVLYAVYHFARKRFRISSFVLLVMLLPLFHLGPSARPVTPADSMTPSAETTSDLSAKLDAFYRRESGRTISFPPMPANEAPFDIIFLHLCSLSWDDLDFTQLRDHALFKRFDLVFTQFNSASTYSGPAVIRLLQGSCGQPRHSALYDNSPAQCSTFNNLQQSGFEPQFLMNHDGHYGGLLEDVRSRGQLQTEPFRIKSAQPYLQSFDGSPVHDDYTALSQWWTHRMQSSEPRVALFYNSISLHDGNHYSGKGGISREIYTPRVERMLADLERFIDTLEASGRRAVLVLVSEHGAAMRGDKMQIAGLREIPSPRITLVPAAIKLIGMPKGVARTPVSISTPSSYLSISQLLANFIAVSPFDSSKVSLQDYVQNLPETEFVAENEDIVVIRNGQQFYIRAGQSSWLEYDPAE